MTASWPIAGLLAVAAALPGCARGPVQDQRRAAAVYVAAPGARAAQGTAQATRPAVVDGKDTRIMYEMIDFEVCRRGGRYYVTVAMRVSESEYISLPDVVEVEPTVESIATALRRLEPLIRNASPEIRAMESEVITKKHLQQMGARSYRQFMRTSSLCLIWRFSDHTEISYMIHEPIANMFGSIVPEADAKLPADASYEDIARAVLDIFAKYPPPPGDKPAAPKRPRKTASTGK
jgi:hypothetical protein